MVERTLMPHGYDSLADYYRAHREEMELARATGCTPIEARAELRRRAKARREACGTRATQPFEDTEQLIGRGEAPAEQRAQGDWDAPWMMRD